MSEVLTSLIQWCITRLSDLLQSDAPEDLAKYLLSIDKSSEIEEFLRGLLDGDDPKTGLFIEELLQRKQGTRLPENITIYRKSAEQDDGGTKPHSRTKSKTKEKKSGGFTRIDLSTVNSEPRLPGDLVPVSSSLAIPQQQLTEDQAQKQGAKRKQKYIPLFSKEGESRDVVRLAGRHWCECQAQKHALVANCLKCGRVVCQQEGSGPCLFCGTLVCTREEQDILMRNSKTSEKLRRKLMGENKSQGQETSNGPTTLPHASSRVRTGLEKAVQHKDRLIEFDHTTVRRTRVIDDESDYFSTDSNQWLSKEDREKLRKRKDELRELKYGSRLKKTFTLDFAGRKIMEESNEVNMYDGKDEVVQGVNFGTGNQVRNQTGRAGDSDIINPDIVQDAPRFIQNDDRSFPKPTALNPDRLTLDSKGTLRIQDRELREMSDGGFCLSMHQPWASLLVTGIKPHEGRTWYSSHRGRLWIAATTHQPTLEEIGQVEDAYRFINSDDTTAFPKEYPVSCLLGCVNMVDCLPQEQYREQHPTGDSSSPYVFICENPQELIIRFPIKGKHKIWKLDGQILKAAKRGLRRSQAQ